MQRVCGPEQSARHAGEVYGDVERVDCPGNGVGLAGVDECLTSDDEQRPLSVCQPVRRLCDRPRRRRRYGDGCNVLHVVICRIGKQAPRMTLEIQSHEPVRQRSTFRHGGVVPLTNHRFVIQQIDGALDEHRARHLALCNPEAFLERRREVAHSLDRRAPFHVRPEKRELVDIL